MHPTAVFSGCLAQILQAPQIVGLSQEAGLPVIPVLDDMLRHTRPI